MSLVLALFLLYIHSLTQLRRHYSMSISRIAANSGSFAVNAGDGIRYLLSYL